MGAEFIAETCQKNKMLCVSLGGFVCDMTGHSYMLDTCSLMIVDGFYFEMLSAGCRTFCTFSFFSEFAETSRRKHSKFYCVTVFAPFCPCWGRAIFSGHRLRPLLADGHSCPSPPAAERLDYPGATCCPHVELRHVWEELSPLWDETKRSDELCFGLLKPHLASLQSFKLGV